MQFSCVLIPFFSTNFQIILFTNKGLKFDYQGLIKSVKPKKTLTPY